MRAKKLRLQADGAYEFVGPWEIDVADSEDRTWSAGVTRFTADGFALEVAGGEDECAVYWVTEE